MVKIEFFSLGTAYSCTTLWVKNSLKIALSHVCGFRDIHFYIFRQKCRKLKFFPLAQNTLVLPCGSKIRSKSLYLLQFLRYSHFFIFRKSPRWSPKVAKIEIFPLGTGNSCTFLQVKNLLEIALSLTVFEIFTLFHFPLNSKMAAKSGEN